MFLSLANQKVGTLGSGRAGETLKKELLDFSEHQRREASGRTALEQRVARLRHEFNEAMTETAMSFTRIHQEFQERGARFEQLHRLIHTGLKSKMKELQTGLDCEGVRVAQVSQEHEQFSNDVGNTITRVMDAQEDPRENYRTLARQVAALQNSPEYHAVAAIPFAVSCTSMLVAYREIHCMKRLGTITESTNGGH